MLSPIYPPCPPNRRERSWQNGWSWADASTRSEQDLARCAIAARDSGARLWIKRAQLEALTPQARDRVLERFACSGLVPLFVGRQALLYVSQDENMGIQFARQVSPIHAAWPKAPRFGAPPLPLDVEADLLHACALLTYLVRYNLA